MAPCDEAAQRLAVYGSLMRKVDGDLNPPVLDGRLRYRCECQIAGRLYDLGAYPGLVCGIGLVAGELYELLDPTALQILDTYEGYRPEKPTESFFRRECVLIECGTRVHGWLYVYNRDIAGRPLIESGNWATHVQMR